MTLLADALTAYLGPLLKKHTAGDPLVFEDLEASHAAASEVLKSNENAFVSKRLDDLHQSQLLAYREVATEALRKWATVEAPLQPMEDHDTESSFVERCVSNAIMGSLWPNWRIPTAKVVVSMEIRKRARATYAKYQGEDALPEGDSNAAAEEEEEQAKDAAAQVTNDEDNTEENGDENDDEGEVDEEDGEIEDDDDDEEKVEGDAAAGKPGNNQGGPKKKKNFKNQNKKKKVVVRKQGINAKQTVQNRKGQNTRSRRGGRGGGAGSK